MRTSLRQYARALFVPVVLVCASAAQHALAQPAVGPNVNMVSGTRWPQGDPFLTKQNEPSIAISSRNPRHLLAGSNDYRLVPVEIAEQLDDPEAWIQVYKSVDGGESWYSAPLGGCPLNIPECNDSTGLTAQLKNLAPNFGADPTARPGPYGTFFLSFIAGTRDTNTNGVVAVQRFVDKNNDVQRGTDVRGTDAQGRPFVRPAQDPILPDALSIIATGTPGQGIDKPWVAADVPGRKWSSNKKNCSLLSWTQGRTDVSDMSESVPAFNVYTSYANFTGQGPNQHPQIFVSISIDCGKTFGSPIKLSNSTGANQGSSIAIDPQSGTVYVVWRNFDNPPAVMISKSSDGGASWSNQPIRVASINPYDQGSTNVSMRTLGFPTVAVSVGSDGKSRVHVAWAQRRVMPNTSPPYACPGSKADDCDARIVVSTSLDGGNTWPAPVAVSTPAAGNDPFNPSVGRGHQIQPTMTFAAGKLLVTWLDQRLDSTEGELQCPGGGFNCPVSQMQEVRKPRGNLDSTCMFPAGVAQVGGTSCYLKDTVFTPYISDGTKYLVRRHTLDVFTAMAVPADVPSFSTSRASQYAFGSSVQATFNQTTQKWDPIPSTYAIRQKEVNPVNLPLFANGTGAFLGDYIDVAAPIIVASNDPANPYKFNVGGSANTQFTTGGRASTFHIAFTDNRDVVPPADGNWVTPTCNTSAFTKDSSGNITGVSNTNSCNGTAKPGPGFSGNRNQNVYSAVVSDHSLAYANFNSKLLNASTPRGFVVTVQNLSNVERNYNLDVTSQPSGAVATFDKLSAKTAAVKVQAGSSATRFVWATSSNPKAQVVVNVSNVEDSSWTSQVLLNPDPSGVFVTNGDGTTTDQANDGLGNVVLSNAVLTNNALSNNALSNNVLSNVALTNAVLSNVVLSNGALSNLAPGGSTDPNVALSNNVLSNVVLSNVVLSNQSLGNVALSNNVLSNVVLTNNALNVALSNLDPTNVALSNVVLSNNALTNVVLSNLDPNNALSNAMLSNNVLSNVALSNVALSNNALSNNVLSNNVLSNVVLSNASIPDQQANAQSTGNPDLDPLRPIEKASPELVSNNSFTSQDLQNGSLAGQGFKDTTFTVRNHGNTDTMLSVKMLLRDAICSGAPSYTCTTPPTFKLQVMLRKVAVSPAAIPPTDPAKSSGQTFRIGLAQRNAEISNVGTLALIDPTDPNFGKFQPLDPNAATLPLAAGEWAYVTIRAIGVNGNTPPDPADLLQWGVKTVSSNATTTTSPLFITTVSFPRTSRLFVALNPATPTVSTFGGTGTISGTVVCTDKNGNAVLTGTTPPAVSLGAFGNWYINTSNNTVYGPKTLDPQTPWAATQPLIQPTNDPLNPVQAILPCPLPPTAVAVGAFTTNASTQVSNATLSFTPKYWGDFYTRLAVSDTTSTGTPNDQQVIKVHVDAAIPNLVFNPPSSLVYNQTRALPAIDLASGTTSDSPVPITFTASGSCSLAGDGHTLVINRASVFSPSNVSDCLVSANQLGNETYSNKTVNKAIFIDRAQQAITVDSVPADLALVYLTGGLPASVTAHVTSTTAPDSGLAVTFSSTTPTVCTVDANSGALTIVSAGTCTIAFDQAGNTNYYAAPQVQRSFQIDKASQAIGFSAVPSDHQIIYQTGNAPYTLVASTTSPTAPASGIAVTFSSATPLVCTTGGTNGSVVSIVGAGTCTINANALGNANYKPAPTATPSFIIDKANQTVIFGAAPNPTFGDSPVTISATTSSSTAPPSLNPAIVFNTTTPSTCTVGTSSMPTATATVPVTIVGAGSCTLTADQAGNANYNAATQAQLTFLINKAPTTITAAAQFFTSFGQSSVLSGKVNRGGVFTSVFPPGPVSIVVQKGANAPVLSVNNLTTAGPDGAFSTTDGPPPTIPSDSYSVTFSYAGDSNFEAAAPVVSTLRVEGFSATAAMSTARSGHTATLLSDGNVLVAGGTALATADPSFAPLATAEIYCAVVSSGCSAGDLGTFKPTTGGMVTARYAHTATRLPGGDVLFAGGAVDKIPTPTAKAELYCATAATAPCVGNLGKFVALPDMTVARAGHTATLLADGTVLLAGGFVDTTNPPTQSTELFCTSVTGPYCTAANAFHVGGLMGTARESHTATLLPDNTVLITGGDTDGNGLATKTAEIYCAAMAGPCTAADGSFKPLTSIMSSARQIHTASKLADGRVLVVGGDDATGIPTATADVYCAVLAGNCTVIGTFQPVGSLATARTFHASPLLKDGRALVLGGRDASNAPLASSEPFVTNAFTAGATMTQARALPTATLLGDGRVLITGGAQAFGSNPTSTAEIYNGPF